MKDRAKPHGFKPIGFRPSPFSDPARFEPLAPILDSRRSKRHKISLPATYRNAAGALIPCRTANISGSGINLESLIVPGVGEDIVIDLDLVGTLPARVVRVQPESFGAEFQLNATHRAQLDRRIRWIGDGGTAKLRENRRYPRIIPLERDADIAVGGKVMRVRIADISRSGARIEAMLDLPWGTPVEIGGRITGIVVRQFPDGFGVDFADVMDEGALDEGIDLRQRIGIGYEHKLEYLS